MLPCESSGLQFLDGYYVFRLSILYTCMMSLDLPVLSHLYSLSDQRLEVIRIHTPWQFNTLVIANTEVLKPTISCWMKHVPKHWSHSMHTCTHVASSQSHVLILNSRLTCSVKSQVVGATTTLSTYPFLVHCVIIILTRKFIFVF